MEHIFLKAAKKEEDVMKVPLICLQGPYQSSRDQPLQSVLMHFFCVRHLQARQHGGSVTSLAVPSAVTQACTAGPVLRQCLPLSVAAAQEERRPGSTGRATSGRWA